jgi:hypothetical protein
MNEEDRELFMLLAEQTMATSDMLEVICSLLAHVNQPVAMQLAKNLEGISTAPEIQKTQTFSALAMRLSQVLKLGPDADLRGLYRSDSYAASRESLRLLMDRLRGH